MKKYQRLFLIIVSVVSLSLFLIYRHHYNRLHHVLEVFNFFGTPCNLSKFEETEKDLLEPDWGPQPLYQELDDNVFVYSAFLKDKSKVHGVGFKYVGAELPKICYLNFEGEQKSIRGKLSIESSGDKTPEGFIMYKFTCNVKNALRIPFSLSFGSQSKFRIINMLITDNLSSQMSFNTTICVTPGVDSFIVYYEQNIPYRLMKLLRNLSRTLNMWVKFLPYNSPLALINSLTNSVIEYDCQFRTKNRSRYSLTLGINDYLVPLLEVEPHNSRIPVKRFCLNYMNNQHPMILNNFHVVDDSEFNEIKVVNKNNLGDISLLNKVTNIFDNYCVIHRYEKCDKNIKTKTDLTMKRFSTDFTRSTLVQMLLHDDLI